MMAVVLLIIVIQMVGGSPSPSTSPTSTLAFDVIVYGATPGGVASAVAAAREGSRVALLTPGLYVGGMMSGGLGQSDYGPHAQRVMGPDSLSTEFFKRVAAHYSTSFFWPPDFQCDQYHPPWVSEPHAAEVRKYRFILKI
jgi:phytoene dehydrogenase-like protein